MTTDEILRDRLWGVFKLLELANLKALQIKRDVALIADTDPAENEDVVLIPCRFVIDGYQYGALMSSQQRDAIVLTIGTGTAADVLKLIAYTFLTKQLYAAAGPITDILIAALTNQTPTKVTGPPKTAAQKTNPVGACKFADGTCQPNCGAPLCITMGGTPCASCVSEGDGTSGKAGRDVVSSEPEEKQEIVT